MEVGLSTTSLSQNSDVQIIMVISNIYATLTEKPSYLISDFTT